jgi:hypothetical protein
VQYCGVPRQLSCFSLLLFGRTIPAARAIRDGGGVGGGGGANEYERSSLLDLTMAPVTQQARLCRLKRRWGHSPPGNALVTDALVTDALVTDALVTDALVTDALVTDALVTDALVTDARTRRMTHL